MSTYSFCNITKDKIFFVLFIIFLGAFLLFPGIGYGQFISTDTTEYRFWYSGFNARSSAMADANVAEPSDLHGLYSNPATLAFSDHGPNLTNNSLYNAAREVLLENITASLSHTKNYRLVGGITFHSTLMNNRALPSLNRMQFSQLDLSLGYAWLLSPSLSAGIAVNSLFGKTPNSRIWTYNASFGLLYAPSSQISYGIVYKGAGMHNGWLGSEPVYRFGNSGETTVYSMQAPHRLELGMSLRFPSLDRSPDFILSFANEKIFGVAGLLYKGGIEIYVQDFMALRGGYFWSPFSSGTRTGVGFFFDGVTLDYAFAPTSFDLNGRTHQLSLSFNF
jgi:hypothetical protein